ncbi:MAG: sulfatase-like hydrolase/transferase [Acidobacteria bacterium]|nr:sulfatase-like hydrolase/transferase [Acidobacteriota bacterium]
MTQSRREFLKTAMNAGMGAGLASFADAAEGVTPARQGRATSEAETRKPNILLLLPDQWRFDWMSTNRELEISTPNLDRLRCMGTSFPSAFVASPLCAPSRACLASGMEYDRAMTPNNDCDYPYAALPTFYSSLRASGYHVLGCGKFDLNKGADWWGLDGKWRLNALGFSDGINNAGKIDQLIGYELNNNHPADPYLSFLDQRRLLEEHLDDLKKRIKGHYAATYPTPLPEEAYCDNWLAGNGLKLLDEAPKDKPWFLQVNWTGPHNPVDITARMETGARGLKMPKVNGTNEYDAATNQRIRQNYTAMCSNIDRMIGQYLDKLSSMGQLENTVVIFSSDHGDMLGDQGLWGKIVPYQPSACVPLIAVGPGIRKGTSSHALVSIMDFAATFLDYAGLKPSATMDSRSLRPLFEGKTETHREVVYSGLGGWRMVCDGRYKAITGYDVKSRHTKPTWTIYSREVKGTPPAVFDLEQDPSEHVDLYAKMPMRAKSLLQLLEERRTAAV